MMPFVDWGPAAAYLLVMALLWGVVPVLWRRFDRRRAAARVASESPYRYSVVAVGRDGAPRPCPAGPVTVALTLPLVEPPSGDRPLYYVVYRTQGGDGPARRVQVVQEPALPPRPPACRHRDCTAFDGGCAGPSCQDFAPDLPGPPLPPRLRLRAAA